MDKLSNRFDGQLFLIVGEAGGLGAAQARRLVAEGARVMLADEAVDEAWDVVTRLGPQATAVALDVADETQWAEVVAAAEQIGPLHGLVNNAAAACPAAAAAGSVSERFERQMRTSQLGVFLGLRAALPALERSGGGAVVNIAPAAGDADPVVGAASAWALRGMVRAAAEELGQRKVRVNAVHPGPRRSPTGRGGKDRTADEVAGLVLFLLSRDAGLMTGAELSLEGLHAS